MSDSYHRAHLAYKSPTSYAPARPLRSRKLNGHDPYIYLKGALECLPTQPLSRIEELLAHRWKPSSNAYGT